MRAWTACIICITWNFNRNAGSWPLAKNSRTAGDFGTWSSLRTKTPFTAERDANRSSFRFISANREHFQVFLLNCYYIRWWTNVNPHQISAVWMKVSSGSQDLVDFLVIWLSLSHLWPDRITFHLSWALSPDFTPSCLQTEKGLSVSSPVNICQESPNFLDSRKVLILASLAHPVL